MCLKSFWKKMRISSGPHLTKSLPYISDACKRAISCSYKLRAAYGARAYRSCFLLLLNLKAVWCRRRRHLLCATRHAFFILSFSRRDWVRTLPLSRVSLCACVCWLVATSCIVYHTRIIIDLTLSKKKSEKKETLSLSLGSWVPRFFLLLFMDRTRPSCLDHWSSTWLLVSDGWTSHEKLI